MGGESPLRLCVYCGQDKIYTFSGKKLRDGSRIFIDGQGSRWAGRRCPDCERKRVTAALHCDRFERDLVIRQLEDQGYTILAQSLPLHVEKDGKKLTVQVRHAYADGADITLDEELDAKADLCAIVFQSVRICEATHLSRLAPNLRVYSHPSKNSPRRAKNSDEIRTIGIKQSTDQENSEIQ